MIKRKIAFMLTLFTLAIPVSQVFGKPKQITPISVTTKTKTNHIYSKEFKDMPAIEGSISDVKKVKNTVSFLVNANGNTKDGYTEIKLTATNKTEIINEDTGKKVPFTQLKDGMIVKAFYSPVVTSSLPPMSTATKIVVTSKKENINLPVTQGNIIEVRKNKDNYINIIKTANPFEGQINLIIDDNTEIIDKTTGNKLTMNDLKEGVNITAYYGLQATFSLPPISHAQKIIVSKKANNPLSNLHCSIIDTFKFDNNIIAYVNTDKRKVLVFISKDTKITDNTGRKFTMNDLNKDVKITIYFNNNNITILDNNSNIIVTPEKVVIENDVKDTSLGTKGTIKELRDVKNGKMAVIQGKKLSENGYDDINVIITKNTEIIRSKDGSKLTVNSLKPGIQLEAYYSPLVTRSIPPISSAKKIIVIAN
ncbi:hypothetical protein OW763_13325 [Clostridium aestuarii]|uniref:Uncharacterized protein n=1 Tax=Clostridium aestuarii TaxID=338193 RepID=A0ABT4D524_9CLOT|nr:hypothetical protein [Clostridium aestuarii]MCY6485315.1 hypothetical protein [Clostridium aestuarii]